MSASGIEASPVDAATSGNDYLVASEAEAYLEGGDGHDTLEGAGGSNFLSGGGGDDTLFSVKGDNVLKGGSGNDVAVYAGNRSDYTVEDQGFGIFAVKSGSRTDFVTEVEVLRFDDGAFNITELVGANPVDSAMEIQANEPAELAPELVVEMEPEAGQTATSAGSQSASAVGEPLYVTAESVEYATVVVDDDRGGEPQVTGDSAQVTVTQDAESDKVSLGLAVPADSVASVTFVSEGVLPVDTTSAVETTSAIETTSDSDVPVAVKDVNVVRVDVESPVGEKSVRSIDLQDSNSGTIQLKVMEGDSKVFDFNSSTTILTEDVWFAENNVPDAVDDQFSVTEGNSIESNVLNNDFDPENGVLVAELVTAPQSGSLVLNPDGSFEYTPAPDFVGIETFTYSVDDGNGGVDTAVVTITVLEDVTVSIANASLVGTTVIHEGDSGEYRVTLDQAVQEDTWFEIKAKDGSANLVEQKSDNQDIVWGGWYDVRYGIGGQVADVVYGRVPNGTTTDSGSREMVGPSDNTADYSMVQDGVVVQGNSVWVKVEAGQSQSTQFNVEAWLEKVTVDNDSGNAAGYNEGTEDFALCIVGTSNSDLVNIAQDRLNVDIVDKTNYQYVSPIGLDLNNDGQIGVTGETSSIDKAGISGLGQTVNFDIDNDGTQDIIEWFAGDGDGILVDNRDGNAANDMHGGRLFGDEGGNFANGYEKLSQLDTDGNGELEGSELDGLNVWVDDGDAVVEAGEFRTLQDLGIFKLGTNMSLVADADGRDLMQATASVNAEITGAVEYAISGADAALFQIDAQTGEMCFLAAPDYETPLDADGDNVYEVTLERVINGETIRQTVEIAICDKVATDSTQTNAVATGNVLDNDHDCDGEDLTASLITAPQNGSVTLNADGSYEYSPNDGFIGIDVFTYQVTNESGGTDSAEVCIEVLPDDGTPATILNADPDAQNDVAATYKDVSVSGSVSGNDSDADGDTLTYSLNSAALNGVVALANDGSYTYTPNAGFTGTDSFCYAAADSSGGVGLAHVTISIDAPANAGPIAGDDAATTPFGETAFGTVVDNDSDPDGDNLTYSLASNPSSGTLTFNSYGTYSYSPNPGFTGQDSFTYTVSDGNGGTATASVTITVEPQLIVDPGPEPNAGPIAVDDTGSTMEDVKAYGTVAGNDSDPDGDTLTYSLVTGPTHGQVTVYSNGSYEYLPSSGYVGQDSFTYQVDDGNGGTDTATVTVNVDPKPIVDPGPVAPGPQANQLPDAVDDSFETTEDVKAYGSVAGNDSDSDGDTLTYSLVTGPANGMVTLYADGNYIYSPNLDFVGEDSFNYLVHDGKGGTDVATVSVKVNPDAVDPGPIDPTPVPEPNQGPTAVDDDVTITEGQPATGTVADNDSDPDGDTLTYSLKTGPANGQVMLYADGGYEYSPAAGFVGQDSFTYQIDDGNGGTDTATVTIIVDPAEVEPCPVDPGPTNAGPDAVDDVNSTIEDTPVSGSVADNDSDPDNDSLKYWVETGPSHGSLILNEDGSYTYTPDPGFVGQDSFTYEANDSNGGTDIATVTITTDPAPNSNPDAVEDYNSTTVNTPVSGKVLCNDVDPDGDALAVKLNTQPSNGTVTVTPGGSYTYTPNDGFSGQDTFTYTITDGNGGCDTATVTIDVSGTLVGGEDIVRNTIDATDDEFSTEYDTEVSGNVLSNDIDPDGDTLVATEMTDVRTSDGGTVSLFADGSFNYTPADGFSGIDTFVYESSDGEGNVTTATVKITVGDPAMLAVDDGYTAETNETINGNVVVNDVGIDNDVTVQLVTSPANGTLTLNSDGTFTYLANDGFSGEDSFRYTLVDGSSTSEANVRLVIAEVNYDTTYVGSGQDGLIWGDPHFRGDDGGLYDVTGEADRVYNLLSDSNLQLNAKFVYWQGEVVDGTVIGELGLQLGNDKLFVDLNGASLNGNDLAEGQSAMGSGTVDYDGTVTTIDTGDYKLTLTRQDGLFAVRIKVIDPFSDFVAPHGLWGQTVDGDTAARNGDFYKDNYIYGLQGGGALDAVDSDGNIVRTVRGDMSSYELYETSDIFSTDALNAEGEAFFRFGARQGTGLNRL